MALAILNFKGRETGVYVFEADIGTAKFFKYVLGDHKRKLRIGKNEHVEVLTGNKRASSLYEINREMQRIGNGRFPLKIPQSKFSEANYIQLYSYPNRKIKVPTISNILGVVPFTGESTKIGGITLSNSFSYDHINNCTMQEIEVRNKACNFHEPKLSQVMFWNTIVSALPTLVEHAAPIIGGLLNSNSESRNPSVQNNNNTSEAINKVVEVLQAISGQSTNGTTENPTAETTASTAESPSASPTENTEQVVEPTQSYQESGCQKFSSSNTLEADTLLGLKPILEKTLTPEAILAIGDDPKKLFMAIKDAVQKTEGTQPDGINQIQNQANEHKETYSKAKVAPALLAAIPALMPVLEKVLNPQTIEAIGNQPTKLFQAIGDVVLKMDEQQIKHLEAINPGVDSADDIAKMLVGMSISHSKYDEDIIKFKMIKSLDLEFLGTKTVEFKGKQRVLYSKNHRIVIPYRISSKNGPLNKSLQKSVIQILIKDAESMDLVFRKNIKVLNVDISKEISEAFLEVDEIKGIPCNKELKLEVSHIWKSNKNENIGVFKSHYVHFIGSFIYDRLGEQVGNTHLLNDVNLHRNYWHKIWEGGFSQSSRWHVEFDLKYYYLLNFNEKAIARLETKKKITDDNVEHGEAHPTRRKVKAKLKSGTELGMNTINNILELLNHPILDESLLQILKKSTIDKSFQQVARVKAEMKGRDGDTATLWSYPEISLHKLHISEIGTVDSYGQVSDLRPVDKLIPRVDFIHFLGTTSEH